MATFRWDCPHSKCRAASAAFHTTEIVNVAADSAAVMLGHCGVCKRVTLFEVKSAPPTSKLADLLNTNFDIFSKEFKDFLNGARIHSIEIVRTYPPRPGLAVPPDVPDNVASAFRDGLKSMDVQLYAPAAFSFRQALERAVRIFVPDGKDGLKARIERLGDSQKLPPAMVTLAHTVRTEGNVAVHEETWTAEETQQLADFTRLLLQYLFWLPAQIKRVEAERGGPAESR